MSIKVESFNIIGIFVRTSNNDVEKLTSDMTNLWSNFMSEGIYDIIENKSSNEIYCVYTDYEADHNGDYTAILGCKVNDLNNIPEGHGLVGKYIPESEYKQFNAKGNLNDGIIYKEWTKIWNSGLDRAYTADFEIYSEKSHNPLNAEVDIFVAVK